MAILDHSETVIPLNQWDQKNGFDEAEFQLIDLCRHGHLHDENDAVAS